jgi:predicted acyltransferase
VRRSLILILLGVFLRSIGRPQTNFTFEDTLSQIGLGYPFLFLLAFLPWRWIAAAFAAVLLGYWLFFGLAPLPPPDFDYAAVGVPADWPHHYSNFLAHWNKNSNAAWTFDRWFLNLFPREQSFTHNGGGYSTLSFIPTLGTMILGLLSGIWLRSGRSVQGKWRGMVAAGLGLLALALILQYAGLCPIVKRIWTPAFTLYSGGWVLLILSAFYLTIEMLEWKRWAFPLLVVGMNSIAIYVLVHTTDHFFLEAIRTNIPELGSQPAFARTAVMGLWFAILLWMHRNRMYIRI